MLWPGGWRGGTRPKSTSKWFERMPDDGIGGPRLTSYEAPATEGRLYPVSEVIDGVKSYLNVDDDAVASEEDNPGDNDEVTERNRHTQPASDRA